jgi:hypothetical protein
VAVKAAPEIEDQVGADDVAECLADEVAAVLATPSTRIATADTRTSPTSCVANPWSTR